MLICPNSNCLHENPDGSKYCSYCGSKLKERSICKNCGKELLPDSKFCPECGTATKKRQKTLEEQEKELENIDILLFKQNVLDRKDCIRGSFTEEDIILENIDKAFEGYLNLAISGNSVAENAVGLFYEKGIYVNKDDNKALEWYERSAAQDCYYAYDNLACLHQYGIGCDKNIDKAISLYQVAANKGYVFSQYNLAFIYFYEKDYQDYSKALYWAKKTADQLYFKGIILLKDILEIGFRDSSAVKKTIDCLERIPKKTVEVYEELGRLYLNFEEDVEHLENAKKAFEYSIRLGSKSANLFLGESYYADIFTDNEDHSKARRYLLTALENGYFEAAYYLGNIYLEGNGLPINVEKSIELYELAESHGIADACYKLGYLYTEGTIIKKDINKGIWYLEKAAQKDNVYAYDLLSDIYYFENHGEIEKDLEKTIDYLKRASALGSIDAMQKLCFIFTQIESYDLKEAIKYADQAAAQGNTLAYIFIGEAFEEGIGCAIDNAKAIEYFSKAISESDETALLSLASIFFYRVKEYNQALNCVDKALSLNSNCGFAYRIKGESFRYGLGNKIDYAKARENLEIAASLDDSLACKEIAIMYYNGIGYRKSYKKSELYIEKASKLNSNYLWDLYWVKSSKGDNQKEIAEIKRKILKLPENYLNKGMEYFWGRNVNQDYDKAKYYFELELNKNNSTMAMEYLAQIYLFYSEGEQDYNKARKLYELMIEENNYNGYFGLGNLFEIGLGTEKSLKKAKYFYKIGLKYDKPKGLYYCARILREEKKYIKAKKYYTKSLANINDELKDTVLLELANMLEYDMDAINGYNEIIKCYKNVLEINPNNIDANKSLTRIFAKNDSNAVDPENTNILSRVFAETSRKIFEQVSLLNKITSSFFNQKDNNK